MILQNELFDPRRNNFTLVRLVLAGSVIYTHSYWLLHRIGGTDDLSPFLGAPVSDYAVDGFFFLSGLLVYQSLLRMGSVRRFLLARIARLWPALALSISLSALAGLAVTTVPWPQYLGGDTQRFLFANLSFMFPAYHLTGVHCGAELCNVNGSLWTLPWEARAYVLLAVTGWLGLAAPRPMMRVILPLTLAGALAWHLPFIKDLVRTFAGSGGVYILDMVDRLWFAFALGIAAYLFRERIRVSWLVLLGLFGVNLIAQRIGLGVHARAVFIGYAVLCLGFLTAKERSISGTWPDYSYGLYIYAFPVMLAVDAGVRPQSHLVLALVNLAATVPLAAVSWHLIEKPALDAFRRSRGKAIPSPLLQP